MVQNIKCYKIYCSQLCQFSWFSKELRRRPFCKFDNVDNLILDHLIIKTIVGIYLSIDVFGNNKTLDPHRVPVKTIQFS